MERDDKRERKYRIFVKKLNREPLSDGESATLAAQDALTEAFGLNRYPAPARGRPRTNAATAAQTGGVSISGEGDPSCPA
jgi:hypothetical protein